MRADIITLGELGSGNQLLSGPYSVEFLGKWYQLPNNMKAPGQFGLMSLADQAQWIAITTGNPQPVADYALYVSGSDYTDVTGAAGGTVARDNSDDTWLNRNLVFPIVNATSPTVDAVATAKDNVIKNAGAIAEASIFGLSLGTAAAAGAGLLILAVVLKKK